MRVIKCRMRSSNLTVRVADKEGQRSAHPRFGKNNGALNFFQRRKGEEAEMWCGGVGVREDG